MNFEFKKRWAPSYKDTRIVLLKISGKIVFLACCFCFAPLLANGQTKVNILPYLFVRGAGAPTMSPDGKTIIFPSSVSGTSQLWKIPSHATPDHSQYWPDQLTFFADPVTGCEFSPDGTWILFRKDEGGNERGQLYLMHPDGSGLDTLTRNPKAIFYGTFTDDGKSILYESNERNEAYFDIYLMDLISHAVSLVHTSDYQNEIGTLSRDGRWLFISRDSGNANNNLYVLDLLHSKPTDASRLLTPHLEDAHYDGFTVSPDSKTLYFFTNQDVNFTARAKLDFQNPRAKVEFRETGHHDVDQDIFSKDGNIEVTTRNIDGVSAIEILDTKTNKHVSGPKLPEDGFISNIQVSHDGNLVAFDFTGAREVGSIEVFDRTKNTTDEITRPTLAGLDPHSFVPGELIHYPSFDGTLIPAYYYKSKAQGRSPVIVSMHGGPEDQTRPWFSAIAQYFVARGYSVLAPNVRGSTGFGKAYSAADNTTKRMTSVRDMEYAGRWLARRPEVDSTKRVIFGGSYGGFMSLAAMTMQPDLWAAGIDLFGIANFHSFLRNTGAWRARNRMMEYGDVERDSAFLWQISPLNHVENIRAPLFVYQGANDPRVPASEAEQIVAAVRAKGIPVEYVLLPDEGHGIAKLNNRILVFTKIVDFLDRVLKK